MLTTVDSIEVIWAALLVAPLLSFATYFVLRRSARVASRRVAILCFVLTFLIPCFYLLKFRFNPRILDAGCVAIVYLAFCYLVAYALELRRVWARIVVLVAGSIPIIALYAISTTGLMLGLLFLLGDWLDAPRHEERISQGLRCTETSWGMVATESGYTIHLFHYWPPAPFIEREVVTLVVDEVDPSHAERTCADAVRQNSG